MAVSFKVIRTRTIQCLQNDRFDFEVRRAIAGDDKNYLQSGTMSALEVIDWLKACRGDQFRSSPHHRIPEIPVYSFTPRRAGLELYIKVYFVGDEPDEVAWFISVHD